MNEDNNYIDLPGGWVWTRLGEICFTTSGGTPSRKNEKYFDGNIPWLKSGELNNGTIISAEESITEDAIKNSSTKIIPKGTLLIALYGATVGKLGILGIDAAINQAVCAISTNNSLDQKFLFWYLRSYRNELLNARKGGAQPNISQQIVNDIPLPLPPPPEQRAIVSKIEQLFSDLDNGIENFKKAQAQLKRYRQSVLKAACEGKLVPTEAELAKAEGCTYEPAELLLARILKERREKSKGGKYKEPAAPDMSVLSALPEGWHWVNIDQLSEVVRGASPRPAGHPKYFGGNIPWITVGEITKDKKIYLTSVENFVTEEGKKASRFIDEGTFLLTNSGATLGVPKITLISGCINDGSVALLGLEETLKLYLYFFLFSQTKKLRQINQGAAQPNLNTSIVKRIVLPLPPLAEQRRIVAEVDRRLSVCDKLEATIAESLQKAEALRQSVLKKAFEGKLLNKKELEKARNAQDWEFAEKLLERIKAEKINIKTINKDKK
jgi:type I restriction enzyme S subunit